MNMALILYILANISHSPARMYFDPRCRTSNSYHSYVGSICNFNSLLQNRVNLSPRVQGITYPFVQNITKNQGRCKIRVGVKLTIVHLNCLGTLIENSENGRPRAHICIGYLHSLHTLSCRGSAIMNESYMISLQYYIYADRSETK